MSKDLRCHLLQKVVKETLDKMYFVSLCHGQKLFKLAIFGPKNVQL